MNHLSCLHPILASMKAQARHHDKLALRLHFPACDNFLYGFKGAPAARQPSGPLGRIGATSAQSSR
jgi:hypothetical protein